MNARLTPRRIGEILAIGSSALWGFFPIVTQLSFQRIDPLWSAGLSALFAVPFFALLVHLKGQWGQLADKRAWRGILMVTLCIGVIFYGLNFIGFRYTSAGNGSIILLMELFFTMAVLRWWGGERLSRGEVAGALLMMVGAFIVLFQGTFIPQKGDLILLFATIFPPLGNYFARQARSYVSSAVVLLGRCFLSGVLLLVVAAFVSAPPSLDALQLSLPLLLINGLVLFGITKLLWLETIHRLEISVALAISAVAPFFTLLYAYLLLGDVATSAQLWGLVPTVLGIVLLTGVLRSPQLIVRRDS
jgi:drug/metabolite transporter (DMT)-like permease